MELWKEAAEQGHAAATYQLGVCHVQGWGGLAKDCDLGVKMIQSAADHAHLPQVLHTISSDLGKHKKFLWLL